MDFCCLVYPHEKESYSSGPYNRLRGKKILEMFEKDAQTKGRIMLADDDMAPYLMAVSNIHNDIRDAGLMPKRLALELTDFVLGHHAGPLMDQERLFDKLVLKNKCTKLELTRGMLQDLQKRFEGEGASYMCYCQAPMQEEVPYQKDIVMCSHRGCAYVYFHRSCVRKLGVEKVTKWYCTACARKMAAAARQTLRDLAYTDIPDEVDFVGDLDELRLLKAPIAPDGDFQNFHDGGQHVGGKIEGSTGFDVK